MKNKSNKNTHLTYTSFENILAASVADLFHPNSKNRLFDYEQFNLIDMDYIHDFLDMHLFHVDEFINVDELKSLINWDELKLLRKKDLDLVNWKEVSYFTQYVGAFTLTMASMLGYFGMFTFLFAGPMVIPAVNSTENIAAKQRDVTFMDYSTQYNNKQNSNNYIADASIYSNTTVANTMYVGDNSGSVLGSSTSDCAFKDASGKFYGDESIVTVDRSTKRICASDVGNAASFVWYRGSANTPVVTNSSCLNIGEGNGSDVLIVDAYAKDGLRTSTCRLSLNFVEGQ